MFQELYNRYSNIDSGDLGNKQLIELRNTLRSIQPFEIHTAAEAKAYIELLRKFREAVAENDKLHGENYPDLLSSLLSVGENGLYSNNLRFIFELIQNVDDCECKEYAIVLFDSEPEKEEPPFSYRDLRKE